MPPREPGQGPGKSVQRQAGQQPGKPRTPQGHYDVRPGSMKGLLGIFWVESGQPHYSQAPVITLHERRLALMAVALDKYLKRSSPVLALAGALAQATDALAADDQAARTTALVELAGTVRHWLHGAVDEQVAADVVPAQGPRHGGDAG